MKRLLLAGIVLIILLIPGVMFAQIDVKESVRVATTAAIVLEDEQTIDGVSVIAGDRVLVKDQGNGFPHVDNGIYDVVSGGAWTRSPDADEDAEFTAGLFVFTEEGATNGDTGWLCVTNNPITVGVTPVVFAPFSLLPTPTPTITPTPTVTRTPTNTRTPSRTPTTTRTPTRTRTPTQGFVYPTKTAIPSITGIPEKWQGFLVFSDDFNQYSHSPYACWDTPWELWVENPSIRHTCGGSVGDTWPYVSKTNFPTFIASDRAWRPGFLTVPSFCSDNSAMMIIGLSKTDAEEPEPEDWRDIMFEVDVNIVPDTLFGIIWGLDPAAPAPAPTATPTVTRTPTRTPTNTPGV